MTAEPSAPVQRLLDLISLEPLGDDRFDAPVPDQFHGGRLFGGQVAAQALRAATLTVDVEHHPHSLHGYFLRPGRPGTTLVMNVDRIRDGSSFSTRRVVATQNGEAIFNLSASFHRDEPDQEYSVPPPDEVRDPESEHGWHESPFGGIDTLSPLEMRELPPSKPDDRGLYETTRRVWVRTRGRLPEDRAVWASVLTFVSDMGAVHAAAIPVGLGFGTRMMGASLDHAVWFHRPIRLDEWALFDLQPISNAGSRALVRGTFHTREGELGASVAQEALVRRLGD